MQYTLQKANIRRSIKERLQKMSENDRRVESAVIVRELKNMTGSEKKIIAIFSPFLDEPNIRPFIEDAIKKENALCIPRAEKHGMMMEKIENLDDIEKDEKTGIPRAKQGNERINEEHIDIVLVPGRAFTKQGIRLGRGSGGYDRWIQKQRIRNPATMYVGVCFDCQVVQEIPHEPHDERVDIVITSTKIYQPAKK